MPNLKKERRVVQSYMTNNICKILNLFSEEDVITIQNALDSLPKSSSSIKENLGRLSVEGVVLPRPLIDKLVDLVNDFSGNKLTFTNPPLYVEYNNKYGEPHLPPHYDGDYNDLIIDYQLSSNTEWPLGVNLQSIPLEDNSALMFNANTNIHWRPHKTFKDGEYVKMIFFRFFSEETTSDYSYLPNHPEDPIFKEAQDYRESLRTRD